jgi:ketosteroid isomerase-like protein
MSRQKEVLLELAAAIGARSEYRIADWFTEDFRLHEPGRTPLPVGHAGATEMLTRWRLLRPPVRFEALDMIEEGDRVVVRWELSATWEGKPFEEAIVAIYRFDGGRIAEDWGVSFRALWP